MASITFSRLPNVFLAHEIPDNLNYYFTRDYFPELKLLIGPGLLVPFALAGMVLAVVSGRFLKRDGVILLALFSLALPLCAWFTIKQRIKMKEANIEVKRKTAEIYSAIESSISGIRTAKAFANEDQENNKFDKANDLFRGAKVNYYKAMGMYMSGMEFTTSIMQVAIVAFGGLLIMFAKEILDFITV